MADIASNRPNLQEHEHDVRWTHAPNAELHVKVACVTQISKIRLQFVM